MHVLHMVEAFARGEGGGGREALGTWPSKVRWVHAVWGRGQCTYLPSEGKRRINSFGRSWPCVYDHEWALDTCGGDGPGAYLE